MSVGAEGARFDEHDDAKDLQGDDGGGDELPAALYHDAPWPMLPLYANVRLVHLSDVNRHGIEKDASWTS